MSIACFLAIFVILLYFLLIRPHNRAKEHKRTLDNFKKVKEVRPNRFTVKVGENEMKKFSKVFSSPKDGTIMDPTTGLMWATTGGRWKETGWSEAKSYCENYRWGGYTNWRMPVLNELEGLYKSGNFRYVMTKGIDVWAAEKRGFHPAIFSFFSGSWHWSYPTYDGGQFAWALPVRFACSKEELEKIRKASEYIDNKDGTVTDAVTGLMWAAKDNGSGINWQDAKRYCENYRGGGYADWRMPTQEELVGLFTEFIQLSARDIWASGERYGEAAYFSIDYLPYSYCSRQKYKRALPVRSGK